MMTAKDWAELAELSPAERNIRMEQIRLVERIVRPVGGGIIFRRKTREELLSHLTGIYQEELARNSDAPAAMEQASRRLGNSADLTRELREGLRYADRFAWIMERVLVRRAGESVNHWLLRQSMVSFGLMLGLLLIIVFAWFLPYLGYADTWRALRPWIACALATPLFHFGLGLIAIKMRDAMYGVFGSPKSAARVIGLMTVAVIGSAAMGFALVPLAGHDLDFAFKASVILGLDGAVMAATMYWVARKSGSQQIADVHWQTLCIE
jgi:hypothetical protein